MVEDLNNNEQPQMDKANPKRQLGLRNEDVNKLIIKSNLFKFEAMLSNVLSHGSQEDIEHVILHFPSYLSEVKDYHELKIMFLSYLFLREKLNYSEVSDLMSDLLLMPDDDSVAILKNALQLSNHILRNKKSMLPGQLWGRLKDNTNVEVQDLLSRAQTLEADTWFRPIKSFRDKVEQPLLKVLEHHTDWISAVEETNDGQCYFVNSKDMSTTVWDKETGKIINILSFEEETQVQQTNDGQSLIYFTNDTIFLVGRKTAGQVTEFKGHTNRITLVKESNNAKSLISGAFDNQIKIWDKATAREISSYNKHTSPVSVLIESIHDESIISAAGKIIHVWNKYTNETISILEGHLDQILSIYETKNGRNIISWSKDNSIRVWDKTNENIQFVFTDNNLEMQAMILSNDEKYIISSLWPNIIAFWNIETGKRELDLIVDAQDYTRGIIESSDSKYIIAAAWDKIKVFNRNTGKLEYELWGHSDQISYFQEIKNGSYVVSGDYDGTLIVWSLETGLKVTQIDAHTRAITLLTESNDGTRLVSGSRDSIVKVWDLSRLSNEIHKSGHSIRVRSVLQSKATNSILTIASDKVTVWSINSGEPINETSVENEWVSSFFESSDGKHFFIGFSDGRICLCNGENGDIILTLLGHTDAISSIQESKNKQYIITASWDSTINIWDSQTGQLVLNLSEHKDAISSITETQDGKYIFSASGDNTIRIWDIETGANVSTFVGHTDWISSVIESRDGKYLVSGSWDKSIKVWNKNTNKLSIDLIGHNDWVTIVKISTDGTKIISGSRDGSVKIWSIETGELMLDLTEGTGAISIIEELSTENYILVGSVHNTIHIWDLETGKIVSSFTGSTESNSPFKEGRDSNFILRDAKIWEKESGKLTFISPFVINPDSPHGTIRGLMSNVIGHTKPITSVIQIKGSDLIIFSSWDKNIRIWDYKKNNIISSIEVDSAVTSMSYLQEMHSLIVGCQNGEVLWFAIENLYVLPSDRSFEEQ